MAGLLDQAGNAVGSLVGLPASILKAYATGYGQLPQRFADEAAQRAIALQTQQQNLDYLKQQRQWIANVLPQLPQEQQLALLTNSGEYGKALSSNVAQHTVAPGATDVTYGNTATPFVAPQFDDKSGSFVQAQPGGGMVQSPGAGGDYKAEGGVVASARTGDIANRYALPQVVSPGGRVAAFTPGVVGPAATAGLPQVAAQPSPTPMASPADVTAAAPGANVTSGYRTPAHNAAVGGVGNSWHTVGTPDAPGAMDLTPGPGQTIGSLAANLTQRLPQLRVLAEGDHVHVQPNARNTGAAPILPQRGAAGGTGSIIDDPGSSAPLWSPPHFDPAMNAWVKTNVATGDSEKLAPGEFTTDNALAMRKELQGSKEWEGAQTATNAVNSLHSAIAKATGNNGVIDMAAVMNLSRAETGGVPRQGTVKTMLEHFGVPQDVENKISSVVGDGALTPKSLNQVVDMLHAYAQTAQGALNARYQDDEGTAQSFGKSLGKVTLPQSSPMPKVKWMEDGAPASAPGAASAPPPPVGFVSRKGYRFNGGDPNNASTWSKVVGR